jgi:glucose dehydrogenase
MTRKIRAFDPRDGQTVCGRQFCLYAGNATPFTYMAGGRQYVLIQADNCPGQE